MLEGKTFLITGATGRLGCELTRRAEELGAAVLPLVLPGYPLTTKRVPWQANTLPIAVSGTDGLDKLPVPTHVVHLHWRVDRTRAFADQVAGEVGANVADLSFFWDWIRSVRIESFVNVSTAKVYSSLNTVEVGSQIEPRPNTPYGIAKLAAEKFLDAYVSSAVRRMVHVRPTSVASMGEHPSQLVSRLCASALRGDRITINKGRRTYLLHIDHVTDLILQAAMAAEEPRYLVAGEGAFNEEIANLVEQRLGRSLCADYIEPDSGVCEPRLVADTEELSADWVREFTLGELLDDLCAAHAG